jgi:NUMOD3 motif
MKHKHHKIPRHMGGTDDPDNIEELTIAQHAEAHRALYEKYGHEQDRAAWLGLSGQTEEMMKIICSMAGHLGKKTLTRWHDHCRGSTYDEIYGKEKAQELKETKRKRFTGKNNPMYGTAHPDKWRKEHSDRLKGKRHFNYGKPAFNRGRVWINDGSKSKMVPKDTVSDLLSRGWILGRP